MSDFDSSSNEDITISQQREVAKHFLIENNEKKRRFVCLASLLLWPFFHIASDKFLSSVIQYELNAHLITSASDINFPSLPCVCRRRTWNENNFNRIPHILRAFSRCASSLSSSSSLISQASSSQQSRVIFVPYQLREKPNIRKPNEIHSIYLQ